MGGCLLGRCRRHRAAVASSRRSTTQPRGDARIATRSDRMPSTSRLGQPTIQATRARSVRRRQLPRGGSSLRLLLLMDCPPFARPTVAARRVRNPYVVVRTRERGGVTVSWTGERRRAQQMLAGFVVAVFLVNDSLPSLKSRRMNRPGTPPREEQR